ncbi:hypothetical protein E1180_18155 [Roseibium denhamense]|uniref:Imelysin-like domain-containing protein n=1 Tax=Roseibium denhamense TaxID=76305 RepID=A0ABY1PBW5_9HYPH|nr:imelysin family protein [Roseibium denhamense]MTI07429.1 hypothetical protein [Roseibium denhamense]SMP29584.1 hypothetical protein SAMN06265374_3119 [Roseibium denhamense]
MRIFIASLLAVLLGQPLAAASFEKPLERLTSGYIVPSMADFSQRASGLSGAVEAVCDTPGEETRHEFEKAFGETVSAFARINFLRFGPLVEDDRLSRLAFLPDTRGIGLRQIRKILAAKDQSALSAQTLGEKSVAVQGLTALQLLAFDRDSSVKLGKPGELKDFTCQYAFAIAENVAAIGAELERAWTAPDGYRRTLVTVGPGDHPFRTSQEAFETVFNALTTGLLVVRDQNLLPVLGTSPDKAKPQRMPFSLSKNGLIFVGSELDGLHAALLSMELDAATEADLSRGLDTLAFEFSNAQKIIDRIDGPIRESLGGGNAYQQITLLAISTKAMRDIMGLRLAEPLGLTGGFNALDGD